MKSKNITTEPSFGIDASKVDTSILMLGIALIERKGLRTLKTLRDFALGTFGKNSIMETSTTHKSRTFQPSLMYELFMKHKTHTNNFQNGFNKEDEAEANF